MNKKLLLFLSVMGLTLLMTSCLSTKVKVAKADFEPTITINGIEKHIDKGLKGTFFLRSIIDKKTKEVKHQLDVRCKYKLFWRYYETASTMDGRILKCTGVDKDISYFFGKATYYEHFVIDIPDDFFQANKTGFSIKVSPQSTDVNGIMKVTAEQIVPQLKKIDELKNK